MKALSSLEIKVSLSLLKDGKIKLKKEWNKMPKVELKVIKNQEVMKVIGNYDGKNFTVTKMVVLSVNDSNLTEKWVEYPKEKWGFATDYLKNEIVDELGKIYHLRNEIIIK
jgi:hypothetical protein